VARIRQRAKSEQSIEQTLAAALELFSNQGFGATTMRQIAEHSGQSTGNLYHHFSSKEEIFRRLLDDYWTGLQRPDHPLQKLFKRAEFPEDLEEMAEVVEQVVEANAAYILLFYVDVVEFRGLHVRSFYEAMAGNFEQVYGAKLAEKKRAGELGDVDGVAAVMMVTRWLFYFFTVEKCFGVPMHFGMDPKRAIAEFIRLIRLGLLPRLEPPAGQTQVSLPEIDRQAQPKGRKE
jgi:AcrR family transcriptional regulator